MTAANAQKVVYPQNVGTLTTGLANRTGTTQDSLYVVAGMSQKPLTPTTTSDKAHGGAENGCSSQSVCFDWYQFAGFKESKISGPVTTGFDKLRGGTQVVVGIDTYNQAITGKVAMPLRAAQGGDTTQKVIIVEKGNRN